MKKIFFFLLLAISFQSFGQKISDMQFYNGSVEGVYIPTLVNGVNRKMLVADLSKSKVDSIVISNDSIFYYKNAGTRYFSGYISGGAQYSNGFGLNLTSNTFKADSNLLTSRLRLKKVTDSIAPLFPATVRATLIRAIDDGADKTSLIQSAFTSGTKEILFDEPGSTIKVNGSLTIPSDRKIIFRNGAKLSGTGSISGGIVENQNRSQCFDLSGGLTVTNLYNTEIYAEWFGVRADALMNGSTVSPTDNAPLIQAAINAGVNRFTGSAYVFRTKVTVGAGPAGYAFYLGSTVLWNSSMEFSGAGQNSTIFVSPNGVGFRYTCPVDDNNPGAEYFTAHDFSAFGSYGFYCPGYFDEDYNGIEINNTNGYFYNIRVYSFKGNGWALHGSGAGISIADNNTLISCSAYQCGGDGLELSGGDANNNTFILFNAYGNARLGIDDNSFLGNTYTGFHTSANGSENTFNRSSVSYGGNRYFSKVDNNINHLPTDANYWELSQAGGVSVFFPAWDNSTEYFVGGDIYLRDASQKGSINGCYSEGGQYRPPNVGSNVILGGFTAGARSGALINMQGVLSTPHFQAYNPTDNLSIALYGNGYNKTGVFDYDNNLFPGWAYNKANKKFLYSSTTGGPPSSSQTELLMPGSFIDIGTNTKQLSQRMALYSFYLARYNIGDYRLIQGRTVIPNGSDEPSNAGEIAFNLTNKANFLGWRCIANTSDNAAGTWSTILTESSPVTESYAATLDIDAGLSTKHRITLTGNATISAPTNGIDGQYLEIELTQDGTGSRTVTWNAVFQWSEDFPEPTLSTTAGWADKIKFERHDGASKWRCVGYILGYH